MSQRRRLGLISIVSLIALAVLVSLVPLSGALGVVVFIVVLGLVGVLFFRFHPEGDAWKVAGQLGVSPWVYVLAVLALALLFFLFRVALLKAV